MIAAATGGMLSWVFYLAFSFLGSDLAQYLISTIVVSAYAEVMARVFKAPVTGFLTIGILPLVPGGGIYYTMEYCVSGLHIEQKTAIRKGKPKDLFQKAEKSKK